jgi:hypothetical protein
MTDITKCTGEGCELKETCYRYTAAMGTYQSMFVEVPIEDNNCNYYWNTNKIKTNPAFQINKIQT